MLSPYTQKDNIRMLNPQFQSHASVPSPTNSGMPNSPSPSPQPFAMDTQSSIDDKGASALMLDDYNKLLTGCFSSRRFVEDAAVLHDAFAHDSSLIKIILKNHAGFLFGKKIFGSETYYFQPFAPAQVTMNATLKVSANTKFLAANDMSLEKVEPTVRSAVRQIFKVNLL